MNREIIWQQMEDKCNKKRRRKMLRPCLKKTSARLPSNARI